MERRVVVVTGASSGIGRAAALAFAHRGASVSLAARREEALGEVRAACEQAGGRAIVVPSDVTDERDMMALADAAVATFGRIDVWINNAGVGLFGPFAAADLATQRRVVETNLFGAFNGVAAALPHFLRRGRGILITTISIGGFIPVPFAAAYTASKFGLRGFMASLRQELRHVPGIRVCSVFPSTVDTPGFSHGANVSGRRITPGWPMLAPERVAEVMVSIALRPRDEVSVGWPTPLARTAYALAPLTTERITGAVLQAYVRGGARVPKTSGNLFEPVRHGTGSSGGLRRPPSKLRDALAGLATVGVVAFGVDVARRVARRQAAAAERAV